MFYKNELSSKQLAMVNSEYEDKKKKSVLLYLLWWFTGIFGGHRFYLGDTGMGVAMLLLGWVTLFIWPLVDVFFIGKRMELKNQELEFSIIQNVKSMTKSEA